MLYECLTGSRPYPADSLEQQIAGHMVAPLPRPSDIDPRLAAFDEVIAKGMAKKPAQRYQTAGELAAAARSALNAPVRDGRVRAAFGPTRQEAVSAGSPGERWRHRGCGTAGAGLAFGAWQLCGGRSDGGSAGPTVHGGDAGAVGRAGRDGARIAATVPADIKAAGSW